MPVPPSLRRCCCLALILLMAAGASEAARAQPGDTSLAFERIGLSEGLSGYVVRAVARDEAGFLWVSTQRGLDRYDGVRVRSFSPRSGAGSSGSGAVVLALVPDPAQPGALWAGTQGGGLLRYNPAREAFTGIADGGLSPTDTVRALLARPDGALWAAVGSRGVWHRPAAAATGTLRALPGDVGPVLAMAGTPGVVWAGTEGGVLALDAATLRPLPDTSSEVSSLTALQDQAVTALAVQDGVLWIGTRAGLVFAYRFGARALGAPVSAGSAVSALAASGARPGTVWASTRSDGLLEIADGGRRVVRHRERGGGLAHDDALAVHEDARGLLWVGTVMGLHKAAVRPPPLSPRVDASNVSGAPLPFHIPAALALAVYQAPSDPATVWVSQARAGLYRYRRETGQLSAFLPDGDPPRLVFSLHEDAAGRLWAGAADGALYLLDREHGTAEAVPLGARSAHVLQIYEAPSHPGVLWLATRGMGLLAFSPDRRRIVRRFDGAGLPANVWRVHERTDDPGALWIGTQDNGLFRLDPATGETRSWQAERSCLASDEVVALESTPDGALWVGMAGGGLARLAPADAGGSENEPCDTFDADDGLAQRDIGSIVADGAGVLWLGSSDGLTRFDPARRAFATFRSEDGLPSNVLHYGSHQRTDDGVLLFGGSTGVIGFDPARVGLDEKPPDVRLTALRIDGEPYPLAQRPDGGFETVFLRPDQRDVAVDFAALDLHAPGRNRYRAWMEGAEASWRALGTRAETRYPVLPHGRYQLRVAGAGRSGVFGEAAVLPLVIRPPLWLRPWVWALTLALVCATSYGAFRWRLRQILRVEHARQRIADDLHDDIGSRMSAVALRLDLVGRAPTIGEADRERLGALAQSARGVVDELRDTVWMVDAGHDDLASLVSRMEQFAAEMLRGRLYTFSGAAALPPVPLGMEARRHLYLFYKEALHNAVRHAGPGPIAVDVAYTRGLLALAVRDEGAGFDAHAPRPTGTRAGRGLHTLQARADALGGDLRIESAPGCGTAVRLQVPLS